jgi:hypothetical protein
MTRRRFAMHLDEKPAEADVERIVSGMRPFKEARSARPLNRSEFALCAKRLQKRTPARRR